MVVLPDDLPAAPPPSLWQDVPGVGVFIRQLLDALMNWRDTAQAQLPGYRDRVCQIRLAQDEGGLNLNMDAGTLARLNERGQIAGTKLAERFDADHRRSHMVTRYLLLMRLLQRELRDAGEKLDIVGADLHRGLDAQPVFRGSDAALRELVRTQTCWRQGSPAFDFDPPPAPSPTPVLRTGPKT